MANTPQLKRSQYLARGLRLFRPSHEHTAFSAALLLMSAVMLSRVIGYVREVYIAWAFGAGLVTDAYNAGFTIPDWLNYILAGGTASITLVPIYTRFLAAKQEKEAQKTFSAIVTIMTTVLVASIVLAEIFTPEISRWWFNGFNPAQLKLCVHLTRILLPAQVFFYVGGVVGAVLYSRRLFLFPAFGPLLYNSFVILGGIVLSRRLGIQSLAWGALVGSFLGPFLINAIGAARVGTAFRVSFDIRNSAFREWVRLTIPLMLGVSLVSADDWIIRHYASSGVGVITRLNYAKRLLAVPIAVLGQATGQASLPFFARLFGERRMQEFTDTVNQSINLILSISVLLTSWMMAAALPLIDLLYRRGHFLFSDSRQTSAYFFWFALSLPFWSAQALYARAFYAAGNTWTPMLASTAITCLSIPMYSALYHLYSGLGLALASDVGIAANCLVMAILLRQRNLVQTANLRWLEVTKASVTAAVAGALSYACVRSLLVGGTRRGDIEALALLSITWAAAVALGLAITGSQLPATISRRRRVSGAAGSDAAC